jgi:hypothetical protein
MEGGVSFYTISDVAACLAHSYGTKSLYDEIVYQNVSSDNIAGLPASCYQYASLIASGFEKDNVNQTRSQ